MKRGRGPLAFALALAVSAAGCGYAASGTWDDDDDNWSRAYGFDTPDGVEVVRSRYVRMPHFTHECVFHFEIAPNADFEKEIFAANEMTELEGHAAMSTLGDEPDWFTPRERSDYEIWTCADRPGGNFRLFIDRESRSLFLADGQL